MVSMTCDNWQYIIYGVLSILCVGSEALGLTKSIKPNSLTEAVINGVKSLLIKKVKTVIDDSPPPDKTSTSLPDTRV